MNSANSNTTPSPKGPVVILVLVVLALAGWGVSLLLDRGATPSNQPKPNVPDAVPTTRPDLAAPKGELVTAVAPVKPASTPDMIEGVVKDHDGNPVPDVTIQVIRWDIDTQSTRPVDQWSTEVIVGTSSTDKNGHYAFNGLDPSAKVQAMRALKAGFTSQFKDSVPAGRQVDFVLMSGVPLSGRVTDIDTGLPIAGVRVKGWFATGKVTADSPSQFRWNENVMTDRDGRYTYEGVPDRNVQFLFYHPDYEDMNETREIPKGKPCVQDFKLKRGLIIEGVVKNRRDGKPLSNVAVKGTDLIVPRYHGKSDNNGVFRITGLKRGQLRFQLQLRGFSAPPDVRDLKDSEMSTAERPNRLEFFMEPCGAVAGVISLPSGTPAANARVWLAKNAILTNSIIPGSETKADEQGRFLLRDLDVGQKYVVVATHREAGLGASGEVVVGPAEIKEDFVLQLPRGGVISGRVIDDGGAPVVGALVTLERPAFALAWFMPPSDVGQGGTVTETTGPDGSYAFRSLWGGKHTIRFDDAEHVSVMNQTAQLKDADDAQTLDVTMSRSKTISGRVVLPDGKPGAGALVEAFGSGTDDAIASAVAAQDGTFKISKLTPGWYRLKGSGMRPRMTSKPIDDVAADTSDIEVRLLALGEVTGFVVDSSGAPVRVFSISLDPIIPTAKQPDRKTPTGGVTSMAMEFQDDAGFFRIKDVEAGLYGILASAGDFATTAGPQVMVEGMPADVGAIRLKTGGIVTGKLRDSRGNAVSGVAVFLDRMDPPVPGALRRTPQAPVASRVDTEGEFKMTGVPAGQYQLRFESDAWVVPTNSILTLADGETVVRNEVLKAAASVTVTAVDQFGEPIPAMDVTVFDSTGGRVAAKGDTPSQKTDLNGRVTMSRIPAETVRIRVLRPGYKVTWIEDVTLNGGDKLARRVVVEKTQ